MTELEPDVPGVGVVGVGMVGHALVESFRRVTSVVTYDPKQGVWWHDQADRMALPSATPLAHVVHNCDLLFLCVPTPMHPDGRQDLTILTGVVAELAALRTANLVVIKSTVAPGTTDRLQQAYPGLNLAFNPEFLREQTAVDDFRTQDRLIIGSPDPVRVPELADLYGASHPHAALHYTTPLTAELVKYAANCFLATKVSFANEIAQLCAALGIDYGRLRELLVTDPRILDDHLQVPGPDGHHGFGMTCFPKDLNALIQCAREHGVQPTVLEAVWAKNLEVRPERDWERLGGRAITLPGSGLDGR